MWKVLMSQLIYQVQKTVSIGHRIEIFFKDELMAHDWDTFIKKNSRWSVVDTVLFRSKLHYDDYEKIPY